MESGSLVSIIVPVYNTENYLGSCIESLLSQTYTSLQIILVDDGSTDGCGEICDAYARKDPRIQVIHQANGGVSSARNAGLDAARGRYVCFVDSDDHVLGTMAEEMVSAAEASACDLCVGGILVQDEDNEANSFCLSIPKPALFRFPADRERRRLLCRRVLCPRFGWSACSQLFRRDIIERHHLRFCPGQKMYEDIDFFFRYTGLCQSLCHISKAYYIYRQHTDSTVHTVAAQERIDWMLRMVKSWESTLAGQAAFPPIYICAGILCATCGLMGPIPRTPEEKRRLTQAFQLFRDSENGEWLLAQARLALRDRAGILRTCGLMLGLRVCGFYRSVLTGNPSTFHWVNRLRLCGGFLCSLMHDFLCGRGAKPEDVKNTKKFGRTKMDITKQAGAQ